jgi:hypothetical protein
MQNFSVGGHRKFVCCWAPTYTYVADRRHPCWAPNNANSTLLWCAAAKFVVAAAVLCWSVLLETGRRCGRCCFCCGRCCFCCRFMRFFFPSRSIKFVCSPKIIIAVVFVVAVAVLVGPLLLSIHALFFSQPSIKFVC